jgi:hypothetical protein
MLDREYLLERCLRLEAELARARGFDVPALPERAPVFKRPARVAIVVTPALKAEMRAMRAEGMPVYRICALIGCAHSTVRRWTR